MQEKIRLGVLFGGQSAEHEVSIQSAKAVIEHLDLQKYAVFPIGIDREGSWHFFDGAPFLRSLKKNLLPTLKQGDAHFPPLAMRPQEAHFSPCLLKKYVDVVFPITHGPYGEDGTIQGLLELANLPYVGCNLLGSALCMDKGMMKETLQSAGLPIPRYTILHSSDSIDTQAILEAFSLPLFVKPSNMGSSVGISKAHSEQELLAAIEEGFLYDERILIEEAIEGKELECSVLGNLKPKASLPGEVIPTHEFYSYEAKYLDEEGARFELPAKLPPEKVAQLQSLAIAAFKALRCEGMARVDFFLDHAGTLLINELNTIPGFTPVSLYPKLWEISGLRFSVLVDELVNLALERQGRRRSLQTTRRDIHELELK